MRMLPRLVSRVPVGKSIDVEVLHAMSNLGRTAWVPTDVRLAFPPNVFGSSSEGFDGSGTGGSLMSMTSVFPLTSTPL